MLKLLVNLKYGSPFVAEVNTALCIFIISDALEEGIQIGMINDY